MNYETRELRWVVVRWEHRRAGMTRQRVPVYGWGYFDAWE